MEGWQDVRKAMRSQPSLRWAKQDDRQSNKWWEETEQVSLEGQYWMGLQGLVSVISKQNEAQYSDPHVVGESSGIKWSEK